MFIQDFKLLKSFVQSEFFFQQKILKKNKFLKFSKKQSVLRNESLVISDPIFNLKSIKQLIRLFQHLSRFKNPSLQIVVNNVHIDSLISNFLDNNSLNRVRLKLLIDSDLKADSKEDKLILLLNSFLNSSSFFFNKSYKTCNILYKINSINENNFFNTYKLCNDLDSLKKLLFLLIVLKQSLNS